MNDAPARDATQDAQQVVEHLQAAALELIAAARAMLDIAEDMVQDPAQAVVMASTLAHMATPQGPPGARSAEPRVQHIRVS